MTDAYVDVVKTFMMLLASLASRTREMTLMYVGDMSRPHTKYGFVISVWNERILSMNVMKDVQSAGPNLSLVDFILICTAQAGGGGGGGEGGVGDGGGEGGGDGIGGGLGVGGDGGDEGSGGAGGGCGGGGHVQGSLNDGLHRPTCVTISGNNASPLLGQIVIKSFNVDR
jgi:hypothetical protein